MSILGLVLMLVILGVVAYFVNSSGKVTATFKMIINVVLIALALILCMVAFGLWDEIRGMKVPKL